MLSWLTVDYVNLGSTGLKVSRLCLGTMTYGSKKWRKWVLEEQESRPFFRRALESGINFFDTADMYSDGVSEEIVGRALKEFGPSRDRLVIATKVFNPTGDDPNQRGLSRKHIHHAIDDSLRRLGTDYVDLYLIHRFDYHTPIEETLEALHDVVRMGKALYLGASSMYAWQFSRMLSKADDLGLTRLVAMQNHYNLIYREEEREMMPLCRAEGIGVTPWSPLARGFVAGNRQRESFGGDAPRQDRRVWAQALLPAVRLRRGRSLERGGPKTRAVKREGGAGLAAASAGRDGAHRRCQQIGTSGRRCGRTEPEIGRGRVEGARGAISAASCARACLIEKIMILLACRSGNRS